jgi:hypothetical protein
VNKRLRKCIKKNTNLQKWDRKAYTQLPGDGRPYVALRVRKVAMIDHT